MARMLSFVAGVATLCWIDSLDFLSHWVYYLILASCGIASAHQRVLAIFAKSKSVPRTFHLCGFCLLGVLYGQWAAQHQLDTRLIQSLDGKEALVTGRVIGLVEKKPLQGNRQPDYYQRFLFKVDSFHIDFDPSLDVGLDAYDIENKHPIIIQINNYRPIDINTSEHWQFRLQLKKPRGNSNPGGFDYTRYLLSKKIDATAYIKSISDAKLIQTPLETKTLSEFAGEIRANRVAVLAPLFDSLQQHGLMRALLLGDRSQISPEHQLLLRRTGTAHLLAISGLHIGISVVLALLITKIVLLVYPNIMLYFPRALIVTLLALPIAAFYAVIAGLSVSTQRAFFMLLCFAFVILQRRYTSIFTTLCFAALLVILIDPLAVLSAGFWFSFAAVATLLVSSLATKYAMSHQASKQLDISLRYRYWLKFKLFLLAQLAIFITMPLVLSAFSGQQSIIAPVANLVIIPIVSIAVVPLGIAGLLLSYLSLPLAKMLLTIADYFLGGSIQLLNFIDAIANDILLIDTLQRQLTMHPIAFIACAASVVILLGRWYLPAFAAALTIWLCLLDPIGIFEQRKSKLRYGEFWLTQFDVGQGSALLISTHNYQLLYDTGPNFSAVLNAANAMIEPYLIRAGIQAIDTIVLSHGDNDHAGGAAYIDQHWQVGKWILGGSANTLTLQASTLSCAAGQQWQQNGVHFSILHPDVSQQSTLSQANENDQSCVLRVKSDYNQAKAKTKIEEQLRLAPAQVLLTGDISRKVEQQLAATHNIRAELLLVPHHGSISSSSPQLLAAVKPDFALASMAFRNRYRHPHPKVVERYLNREIPLYRSDQLGAMQFRYLQGQWYGPYCARYIAEHFWQDFDNRQQCTGPLR